MIYYERGSEKDVITSEDMRQGLYEALEKLGKRNKVMVLPPDFTRFHSRAGDLTEMTWDYYQDKLTDVMPALGTHSPMRTDQISRMFGKMPNTLIREHRWRDDLVTLGEVPSSFIKEVSEGKLDFSWPAQVNTLLVEGGHDLILSIGQVVPHEVIGMANYTKNVFIGVGGAEGIHKSHFLGAVYGMERIMGQADSPVRQVLNYGADHFSGDIPLVYVLTVLSRNEEGDMVVRGLYIGDDQECYQKAAALSYKVNFITLPKALKKVVVYLDPEEYQSTWLGNKSVYRTRMALADGGELIVLAPGVKEFGEDKTIDALIRKYGYKGTPITLDLVKKNQDLADNLSAAAHLIHGSSEGRFSITYCPGHLSKDEIEGVGFNYGKLEEMNEKYNPDKLKEGFNQVEGEEIYFISNPAVGLWAYQG